MKPTLLIAVLVALLALVFVADRRQHNRDRATIHDVCVRSAALARNERRLVFLILDHTRVELASTTSQRLEQHERRYTIPLLQKTLATIPTYHCGK